jgi:hypothetical protein
VNNEETKVIFKQLGNKSKSVADANIMLTSVMEIHHAARKGSGSRLHGPKPTLHGSKPTRRIDKLSRENYRMRESLKSRGLN